MVQLVTEREINTYKDRWRRAAFIGWQSYAREPRSESSPPPLELSEYFEMFGLGEENAADQLTDEQVLEDARELMSKFGVSL